MPEFATLTSPRPPRWWLGVLSSSSPRPARRPILATPDSRPVDHRRPAPLGPRSSQDHAARLPQPDAWHSPYVWSHASGHADGTRRPRPAIPGPGRSRPVVRAVPWCWTPARVRAGSSITSRARVALIRPVAGVGL